MDTLKQIDIDEALLKYQGEDRVISASEAWAALLTRPRSKFTLISRIPTLDKIIDGFHGGQLVVVSGTTGHGKTTFSKTLTRAFAEQGVMCLWFSFEVDLEDFLQDFPAECRPRFYLPAKMAGKDTKWIAARILEGKLKYGIRAVFIDHLHYIINLSSRNASLDIGVTVRDLKRLAVEHNITIFLICHTMKTREDRELQQGDVRDSSLIEQEADTVLYLWRTKTPGETVLKVTKNRKRGVIDEKIPLRFEGGRYFEKADMRGAFDTAPANKTIPPRKQAHKGEEEQTRWEH